MFLSDSEEEDATTLKKIMSDIVELNYGVLPGAKVQLDRMFLHDFMPRVQKFFKVPTKMSYCEVGTSSVPLNQNEVLSAFMNFLLQIWNSEANRDDDEDDYFGAIHKKENFGLVHKGLKYLLAYLGDVPFQCCPTHQLKDLLNTLLAQFESLANQVGHFTFCYILSPQLNSLTEFDAHLDALLQIIELLNANITKYCIAFSKLVTTTVTISNQMVTRPIDSLFIVDSLLTDLQSLITQQFHVTINVDMKDQITALFDELKLSKIFLKDVELMSRETVNGCVITIREISYEAEYIINSYVVGSIPVWYLRLRLPSVIDILKLNLSRLQEIKSDGKACQVTGDFTKNISLLHRETAMMVVEDQLVGIEKSKIEILEKLTRGDKSLKIISLIGMPGLGKTTLAKNLFDSSSVFGHFDRRAWCVISQNYEKRKVFIDILTSLNGRGKEEEVSMDDEALGLRIHQSLKGYRYLIIIDDIWVSQTWDEINRYFPDDNKGSRIMLTSRIKDATPSESIFPILPLLSQVDSMKLLVKKVFLNEECPPQLRAIGNIIAKRCKGLPLAVVAIAGVLANLDQEESVWEKVARDLGKVLLDSQGDCMEILEFSYENLPDHLKMCFLYLGSFPEDTKIPIRNILRLWVAEGFIEEEKENSPEDVAKEYLHDLINRSLVSIVAKRKFGGSIKACGLHDLLRELCRRKADEENFIKSTEEPFSLYMRRHIVRVDCDFSSHFGQHRRSFSGPLSVESYSFPQMPLHRVIADNDQETTDDPSDTELEGIDMLVHLRYLCAPQHKLSCQSASNLVNLEFLDVSCFSGDKIALSTILKMVKLKHLKTREITQIIPDCSNWQITNLQSLSVFVIDNLEDEKFLKVCPHLQNLKCWSKEHFPDLSSCTKLETLNLKIIVHEGIDFEKIMLPTSIRKLTLSFFSLLLPWDAMSKIGKLPNLQELNLMIDKFCIGPECWETRDDEFQELRFLKFVEMPTTLKRWITCSEHFPKLKCLVLKNCKNLQDISSDLGNISTLETIEVYECNYTLIKSAVLIEIEQHDAMGNKEFQVKISNQDYWSKEDLMQEYRKLKETFSHSIENGGYNITSTNELGAAIRSVTGGHCPSEAELQSMINEIGSIDFPDFVDLISEMRVPYSEHELQKAFQFFYLSSYNYFIDSVHLNFMLTRLGQEVTREEAKKMVREADTDGDGKLNYDEFKKLMMTIDVPKPYDLRTALLMAKTRKNDDDDDGDDYDDGDGDGDGDDLTGHDPTIIHFSHPHFLQPIFIDQIPKSICSGCRHKSSPTMYACQPCNFILHCSCAKLPEQITIPCHIGCTLSLLFVSPYYSKRFICDGCNRGGSGWVYNCKNCKYDLHVSCASKQLKIKHNTCKLEDAIHFENLLYRGVRRITFPSSAAAVNANQDKTEYPLESIADGEIHCLQLGTNLKFDIQTDQGRGFRINSDHLPKIQLNRTNYVQIGPSSLNDVSESEQLGVTDESTALANKIDMLQIMDKEVPVTRQVSDEGNNEVLSQVQIIPAAAGNVIQEDKAVMAETASSSLSDISEPNEFWPNANQLVTNLKFDQGSGIGITTDHHIRSKNRKAKIQLKQTKPNKWVKLEIRSSSSNVVSDSYQLGETGGSTTLANKIDLTGMTTDNNQEDRDRSSIPIFVFKASK